MTVLTRPDALPVCDRGHVAVCVTRGTGLRRVCPECLSAALGVLSAREVTVNDYLVRLEVDGQAPKLTSGEAEAVGGWMRAADELHGDTSPAGLRKVVRGAARAAGVPSTEVMKWTLRTMTERGLKALRAAPLETSAA